MVAITAPAYDAHDGFQLVASTVPPRVVSVVKPWANGLGSAVFASGCGYDVWASPRGSTSWVCRVSAHGRPVSFSTMAAAASTAICSTLPSAVRLALAMRSSAARSFSAAEDSASVRCLAVSAPILCCASRPMACASSRR